MPPLRPVINYSLFTAFLVAEIKRTIGVVAIIDSPTVQQAPRPRLPYMSFNYRMPSQKYGYDSVAHVEDNVFNVGGLRRMILSFSCYAETQEEAYAIMTTWQSALELPTVQERCRAAKMPVWGSEPVVDLSQLLNTGWEARAQMDAYFGLASNVEVDLGAIETVEGVGTVNTNGVDEAEVPFEAEKP